MLPFNALVREHPRLPCVKGAVMAVSRKAMTEGLSKYSVLIPSVSCLRGTHETAPLGQQGEPLRSAVSSQKKQKSGAANGRPAQRVKKAPNIRCHSEPVRLSGVGIPRIEVKATGLGSKMFENSGDCHGSVRTASQ